MSPFCLNHKFKDQNTVQGAKARQLLPFFLHDLWSGALLLATSISPYTLCIYTLYGSSHCPPRTGRPAAYTYARKMSSEFRGMSINLDILYNTYRNITRVLHYFVLKNVYFNCSAVYNGTCTELT